MAYDRLAVDNIQLFMKENTTALSFKKTPEFPVSLQVVVTAYRLQHHSRWRGFRRILAADHDVREAGVIKAGSNRPRSKHSQLCRFQTRLDIYESITNVVVSGKYSWHSLKFNIVPPRRK
jgi:hypothetical protein